MTKRGIVEEYFKCVAHGVVQLLVVKERVAAARICPAIGEEDLVSGALLEKQLASCIEKKNAKCAMQGLS